MGECGLDYSQRCAVTLMDLTPEPPQVQRDQGGAGQGLPGTARPGSQVSSSLVASAEIFRRYNLPLVLHAREAEDDLYILLR